MFAADLHFSECPRWHDGSLWLSDMWGHTVYRFEVDGSRQVVHRFGDDEDPGGLGWLPDGRLLVVGMEGRVVYRLEGAEVVVHADLRDLSPFQLNDMVVAPDGTAYVTQFGYDMWNRTAVQPSPVIAVAPDGTATAASEPLVVPNGIAVLDDELVVAEAGGGQISRFRITAGGLTDRRVVPLPKKEGAAHVAPDGLCLDAGGGIWTADPVGQRVLHVTADGAVDRALPVDDGFPVACVLGGPDRRTLYVCVGSTIVRANRPAEPSGRVLTFEADVPGAGRP